MNNFLNYQFRLYRTVKHLKFEQILFRFLKLFPKFYNFDISDIKIENVKKKWIKSISNKFCSISKSQIVFLNKCVPYQKSVWHYKTESKLWNYNLNYFNFLNQKFYVNKSFFAKLIDDWILNNNNIKNLAWDPYPTSIRITNWIKWSLNGNKLKKVHYQSLLKQSIYLNKNIEKHLLGNHLLVNAKAIFFAGMYFNTYESDYWLKKSILILKKEFKEQILDDGGHFERSPMYNALILEDLLDIYNIINVFDRKIFNYDKTIKSLIKINIKKMLLWQIFMSHPDGKVSFFNDSCFDVANNVYDLLSYAKRLKISTKIKKSLNSVYFKNTGYISVRGQYLNLIADVANLGPDYLPAHGHADSLSFEVSLKKQRVIVNSGISTYEINDQRIYERSTRAHSTLMLDNHDSSEVWSSFRVGRRAKISNVNFKNNIKLKKFSASHDGYIYKKGNPIVRRIWSFEERKISIVDTVNGSNKSNIKIYFYFHPYFKPLKVNNHEVLIKSLNQKDIFLLDFSNNVDVKIGQSFWYPEFNKKIKNCSIELNIYQKLPIKVKSTIRLIDTA